MKRFNSLALGVTLLALTAIMANAQETAQPTEAQLKLMAQLADLEAQITKLEVMEQPAAQPATTPVPSARQSAPQYPQDTLGMGLPPTNSVPPGCAPFGYDGHIECPGFGGSMGYGLGYAGNLGGSYGFIGPKTFAAWDEETANKIRDRRHSAIVKYDGSSGWLEGVRLEFWDGDDWVVPSRPEGASHRYQKPYIVTVDDAGRIRTRYTDAKGVSVVRNEKLVSMAQAASNGKRGYINKIPIDPSWFKPKTAEQ